MLDAEQTRRLFWEIRRLTGLTFGELAQLFSEATPEMSCADVCTKATLDETHIVHVSEVIKKSYRGNAASMRAALFQESKGATPFRLLVSKEYEQAFALLGSGVGYVAQQLTPLSAEAWEARKPLPPDILAGALEDSVHTVCGKLLSAYPILTCQTLAENIDTLDPQVESWD